MSNGNLIVQSKSGEVRIEGFEEGGNTVFRTYVLNTRVYDFDENDYPAGSCNPRGVAKYYAHKVKNYIRPMLVAKESTAQRVDQILAELVSEMQ